jgi:uncharacterized protein YbaA (DUF1428 family)
MIGLGKVKISNSILGVLLVYDKLLMQGNSDHTPYIYYLVWQGFSGSLLPLLTGTEEDGEQNGTGISKNLYPLFLGEIAFLLWIIHQCKEIDYAWWHRCIRLGVSQKLQACQAPSWMKEWLRIAVMGQDALLAKKKQKILQIADHQRGFVPETALEGWYRGLCCRSLYLDKEITTIPPYMLAYADISEKVLMRYPIQDIGEKACYRATLPAVVELTGPYPSASNKKSQDEEEDKGLLQISEQAFGQTAGLACLHIKGYASGWIRTQSFFQASDLQYLTIQIKEIISLERGAISTCPHLRVVVIEGQRLKTHPHWEAIKDCPALEIVKIPQLINPEHVVQASFSGVPALKKLIIADEDYARTNWRQTIAEGKGFTVISHSASLQQAYAGLAKEAGIVDNTKGLASVLNKQDAECATGVTIHNKQDVEWDSGFNIPLSWIFYDRKEELAASIQKMQKIPTFTLPLRWRHTLGVYSDPLVGQGFFTRKESCNLHEALCLAKQSHAQARLYPRCGDTLYASASVWDLLQRWSQGKRKTVPA